MNRLLSVLVAAGNLLITAVPLAAQAQVAEIAGAATTGAVLKQLIADLTTMINKARDDGDYLLARAGDEAKDALDAWQEVNSNLLDKKISDLLATNRIVRFETQ